MCTEEKRSTTHAWSRILLTAAFCTLACNEAIAIEGAFPISRCVFRVPYDVDVDGGEFVQSHSVNFLHLGHNGVDLFGRPAIDNGGSTSPPVGYPLVAARSGWVRRVTDTNTGCCRNSGCSACNNQIWIQHNADEFTVQYHLAPNSAVVVENEFVQMGDVIAMEGDTGSVCANGGVNNRPAAGCSAAGVSAEDAQAVCPFCAVHVHFTSVYGYDGSTTGDTLNGDAFTGQTIPIVCNIDNNLFEPGETYADGNGDNGMVGNCFSDCPVALVFGSTNIDAGEVVIRQADETISASDVNIDDDDFGGACTTSADCTLPARCSGGTCRTRGASVAFRAGFSVRLRPGFHAERGTYFQGLISDCNGCPAPF